MNYINGLSKMEKQEEGEGKAESKEARMHVKLYFTAECFSNIEEKIG